MIEPRGMIFVNEHETNGEKWYSYSLSVSSKNQKDEWENASMPVRFMKGVEPPVNKTRITITDGWLKPYKFKDGFVVGWFVKAYEVIGTNGESGFTALVQDDVPF